jgi:hypothetical protein
MTKKEVRVTVVSFEEFSDYEFNPPATFYIMDSLQQYYFVHTSDRKVAQDWVDETFGKGRYTVKASKIQKTKFKSESGTYSAVGVATRKGQKKYN